MKKMLTLIVVTMTGWFLYSGYVKSHRAIITSQGETYIIEKPNNKFVLSNNGDTHADLRVFGFNSETMGSAEMGPHAIDTHLFIVSPMAENEEIFRRQFCEQASFNKASMVNVIAENKVVFDKVEKIRKSNAERKCVRVTGKSLLLKQEFYKGEPITVQTGADMPYDGRMFILLSDIESIGCQ